MANPSRPVPRVPQARLRRLYRALGSGLYDDDLLREVGWTLFSRCQEVLTVTRAVQGEVPCPRCSQLVMRPRHAHRVAVKRSAMPVTCPGCGAHLTWETCRQALLDGPRCFGCRCRLQAHYAENELVCPACGRRWPWRRYRASVNARRVLPCPHCGEALRRPPERRPCGPCATSEAQSERLHCSACGHDFTWAQWRKRHGIVASRTGNLAPVERFLERWPRALRPEEQAMEIDALLHAMHIRGSMAHLFLEGDESSLRALLDELSQWRPAQESGPAREGRQ